MDNITIKTIVDYIIERNNIYIKKTIENKPFPWTDNLILRKHFFINVYRQLDKHTIYELNYIKNNKDEYDQLVFILLFRYIITIPMMDILLKNPTKQEWTQLYHKHNLKLRSCIIFHTPKGMKCVDSIYEYYIFVKNNIKTIYDEIKSKPTANSLLKYLKKTLKSVGDFKAYEIYTSLTYTNIINFTSNDCDYVGKGAQPVLDHLHMSVVELKHKLIQELTNREFVFLHKFTNRTTEDCCCEMRKYYNIKTKNIYKRLYHIKK